MAHHNSTPRSVFVPPGTTPEAATHAAREARAHGPNKPYENTEHVVTVKAPLVRRMVRALRGSKGRAA